MALRVAFMGTPRFAVPSLQRLLEHPFPIVAVVTVPDKPQGRGRRVSASPVKAFALERGLPVLQPSDLRDPGFLSQFAAYQADVIVVVAFRILPAELYSMPPRGAFNLHASLLPRYRGAAPIQRAIMNGERETGVTTFFLKEKVDTGQIILRESTPIGEDENAGDLADRLANLGADVVVRTVQAIEQGATVPVAQREEDATSAPKILKEDCWIDWSKPSSVIHNQVRALSPEPGALASFSGRLLKIYAARASALPEPSLKDTPPGTVVLCTGDQLAVRTGDGALVVDELQQEGRKRLRVGEFLRGFSVAVGMAFAPAPTSR